MKRLNLKDGWQVIDLIDKPTKYCACYIQNGLPIGLESFSNSCARDEFVHRYAGNSYPIDMQDSWNQKGAIRQWEQENDCSLYELLALEYIPVPVIGNEDDLYQLDLD